MNSPATCSFFIGVLALVSVSAQLRAEQFDLTAFSKVCADRMPNVQEDRRTCVVGIVQEGGELDVLITTHDLLAGRKLSVFSSSVVQRAVTRLAELADRTGQIVVVGGFLDGTALYSATTDSSRRRLGRE
jgi:hypothetical protein